MAAPDDELEQALRQALAAAVGEIQPTADGLERIRARISGRPPRPWLLSVAAGVWERARRWTWRGHWARPRSLVLPAFVPWPQLLRLSASSTPRTGRPVRPASVSWLRPVAVLAGIALLASVSLGVQPFRQALIQASDTVLTGGDGGGQQTGSAGTDGNARPVPGPGSSTSAPVVTPPGPVTPGYAGATMTSGTPSPTAVTAAGCPTAEASLTAAEPGKAAPQKPAPVMSSIIPSAVPYYSGSPSPSCAAPSPSGTPSPTASASPSSSLSPTPAASDASPSPSVSTPPSRSPSPSPSPKPSPSSSPSASPTSPSPSTSPTLTPSPSDSGGSTSASSGAAVPVPAAS